ncbi:MraZ protein [Peptoniphilus asaccharolyticus DSM 20463]|uniref:Transcriptional regulator MraZ n=1 Tax=Peptoniphilus asaccharolyticus DSM 20463 TaxID=573058 RepID=A0A1W1UX17_PEPAS|nr:division/cell wall cluster transcriptional repressor MraZ [Peptoniphilus asaccharolyticus]MBL7575296.1 division/cell wall cluster transcriptional repressor MraZ [Peptoniphilus asaccharolyticus]SMB85576.1 MraZ protein [Peptoniphilus asaccharolyticus DSM 20463]
MLIGEYRHTLDAKGRVIIPSKFRDELKDNFIITKGLDNCLFIYPKSEWIKIEDKLKELPLTNRDVRSFVRTFYSGAVDESLDKQGRVVIPQSLRNHASIEKDVVIIGVSTRVEIWSTENWDNYNDSLGLSYEDIAEKMQELGI